MVLTGNNSAQAVLARVAGSTRTSVGNGLHKLELTAMSTTCRVHIHGISAAATLDFQNEVVRWVAEFEAKYSRFIPDSVVGRINAAAGEHWVDVDDETDRLLDFCRQLVLFTRGAFDPTALPLVKLWKWNEQPAAVPSDDAIAAARELVGWNKVQRRHRSIFLPCSGMSLDLGGIGKEYAVDRVVSMALERGILNVLADFGLDVRAHGHAPGKEFWSVGLEEPAQPGKCWFGLAVKDHGIATSGDYVRSFQFNGRRYGHILDPRSGCPVNNGCRAVSVVAPTCTVAGALATTAFVLGPQEGMRLIESHPEAQGAIVMDSTRICSRGFHEYAIH
jgi:thiamine biosynthesis lipoprotein